MVKRPRPPEPTQPRCIAITATLERRVKARAAAEQRSFSSLVRVALEAYLARGARRTARR